MALVVPFVVLAIVAPGEAAMAKTKPKSRGKVITVSTGATRYLLTVDGRFSLTSGDIVDDGTLSVPVIAVTSVKAPGQPVLYFGAGNGRVVEHLAVTGKDCDLRSTVSFTMNVGPTTAPAPAADAATDAADLAPLTPAPPVVPPGSVGFMFSGVALGLVAAATPGASTFDLGGVKKRMCTFSTDPLVQKELTVAGAPAADALAAANTPPLIFPSAGGTITRRQDDGILTYFFTYKLKRG